MAGGSAVGGDALIHRRPSSAVRPRALPALSAALPDFRQRCPQHEPHAGPALLSGGSTGGASHKTGSLNSPGDGTATGTLKGHRVAGHLVDLDYPVSFFVARGMRPGRLRGAVAGAGHQHLVAGVDQSVEEGLSDHGVGEQRIPVGR